MLTRQFCLGSNLPTHTGENADLQSAEANFEG